MFIFYTIKKAGCDKKNEEEIRRSQELHALGIGYYKQGKFLEALEQFKQANKLHQNATTTDTIEKIRKIQQHQVGRPSFKEQPTTPAKKNDYTFDVAKMSIDKVLLDSKITSVKKLSCINKILQACNKNDLPNIIHYLTSHHQLNFFEVLSSITVFDPDDYGSEYTNHLAHVQAFLLKYIQLFDKELLHHAAMRKLFSPNEGYGGLLVMSQKLGNVKNQHEIFEKCIKTALEKCSMPFFNMVIAATRSNQRVPLLKKMAEENPLPFYKLFTTAEEASLKEFMHLCSASTDGPQFAQDALKLIVPYQQLHSDRRTTAVISDPGFEKQVKYERKPQPLTKLDIRINIFKTKITKILESTNNATEKLTAINNALSQMNADNRKTPLNEVALENKDAFREIFNSGTIDENLLKQFITIYLNNTTIKFATENSLTNQALVLIGIDNHTTTPSPLNFSQ